MLEKSENTTSSQLTSFVEGSRAKTSRRSKSIARDLKVSDRAYGLNTFGFFARCDLDTWSLRTSQPSLLMDWIDCSVTLPVSGLMRNGRLYERRHSDCLPAETGFSLLPTPRASDPFRWKFTLPQWLKCMSKENAFAATLPYVMKVWNIPFQRYPNIYEWIMGFPLNYLKLKQQSKDTETPSLHQSQNGSVNES